MKTHETASALCERAAELQSQHRLEEALENCDAAVAAKPDHAEALTRRGIVLAMLRRFEEALESLERAVRVAPGRAETWTNRGNVLGELKRFEEALASYDEAISLTPGFSGAHYCRALALAQIERFDEALAGLDRALALAPGNADAWTHRGNVLTALKRHAEAVASYDRALAIRPDDAKTHNDRGVALAELGCFDAAVASYDKAISLNRVSAEALHNRGLALAELGRVDDAIESHLGAITINPDFAEAHLNEGLCRLLAGDFRRGWGKYEWRWKTRDRRRRPADFPQPAWQGGDDIRGRTILLHAEQGFGDTLQFCRYACLVAERGARVVLLVPPPLRSIMESLSGPVRVLAEGDPLPAFDAHCSLMSLPLAFGTTADAIPARVPYLTPAPERVAFWQERIGAADSPRVGLAWSGHPQHNRDRSRSVPLEELAVLAGAGGGLFSLQREIRESDRDAFESIRTIRHFGKALADFSDTAALISLMDVVISADTSVAHLAGAMGKRVWMLLPRVPDWRWLLEREDSPWYPTARLFRQTRAGDWSSVVARVAEELRRLRPPG